MKLIAIALSLLPLSCLAQQAAPPASQMVVKGADIANLISQSTAGGSRRMESLLRQGPYKLNLEYHSGSSGVGLNEDAAELMLVMEGSGAILLGGTPVDPVRTGAHLQARTAEGSVSYAVEKGDVIVIPQALAHAIGSVNDRLILMSIHLPPGQDPMPGDLPLPELDTMMALPLEPPPGTLAAPKSAPVPTGVPIDIALDGARAAIAACKSHGDLVGVAVTDDAGQLRAALGADGASNGRIYAAVRKDMTVAAFKMSSGEVRAKVLGDPAFKTQIRPGMAIMAGGLPLTAGGKFVGAIAVSGSTQTGDEKCARAGLQRIESRLK